MCVLALAWRAHPRWRLVLAGNRDELHARPADPLARWQDAPHILAGRDRLSCGTWLGVSEQGRLAVVTNLRGHGAPRPEAPSRGALVRDQLLGDGPYAEGGIDRAGDLNPFNLIRVRGDLAEFWTNRPMPTGTTLTPGLYGLSNGGLNEPWPKTLRLKGHLATWLSGDAARPASLLGALQDETLGDEGVPPAISSDTPLEPLVSPIFIRNPVYGTRCATVVAIDSEGAGRIIERRFDANGQVTGETALDFGWPA
jgi:uncharacterized protein with NRDE domain